jgi:hypothetical protein
VGKPGDVSHAASDQLAANSGYRPAARSSQAPASSLVSDSGAPSGLTSMLLVYAFSRPVEPVRSRPWTFASMEWAFSRRQRKRLACRKSVLFASVFQI